MRFVLHCHTHAHTIAHNLAVCISITLQLRTMVMVSIDFLSLLN